MRYYRLLLVLFVLVAASCSSRQVAIKLSDIESYIEEHPDSALTVLESLPNGDFNSKELRARYSLLYAMALDKNYIDTTDVSIIQPAIQYFKNYGTADEKMKAYYYQGIAYFNKEEYDNAIVSFTYAEEMIPDAKDRRYVGLVYSRISDLYNRSHNAEEELKYIGLAADTFAENHIDKYQYTTLLRKGEALAGIRRFKEARDIYSQLLSNPEVSDYVKRLAKEDYALLLVTGTDRDVEQAMGLFREVLSETGRLRSVNYWSAYAYCLAICGNRNESELLFSQLYAMENKDYSVVDVWKASVCKEKGDYREALSLLENTISHQDSLMRISVSQATMRAQRDYLAFKNTQLQIEDKNHQLRSLIVIIVLVVALLTLFIIYRLRSERLKHERNELVDIAETMRGQLKESEAGRASLKAEYAKMYKVQFRQLGELCEMFLLANEKKDSQRIVYDKVQGMIKDISGDKKGQRRFEDLIDKRLDDIMRHFREDFQQYQEEDYRFISFVFAGFDATTICVVTRMPSVAAVYMKKSRMKKTIQESSVPYREKYLDMMT